MPDLFIISIKMKLHLELYDPALCTKFLCDKTIDIFGMHTFCCIRVSRKAAHDHMVFTTALFIRDILLTAGIIAKGSVMYRPPPIWPFLLTHPKPQVQHHPTHPVHQSSF